MNGNQRVEHVYDKLAGILKGQFSSRELRTLLMDFLYQEVMDYPTPMEGYVEKYLDKLSRFLTGE